VLFSAFIQANLDKIVGEWETFARGLLPSKGMTSLALRDHSREILLAIAKDMETSQSGLERFDKSHRMTLPLGAADSAASTHGALRHLAGFDLTQLVGEFRAMRASVLAMWRRSEPRIDGKKAIEEIARFNEGMDQAIAESVERYATDVSTFLAVVGHDLRSPLWSIQGTSELLARPELPDEIRIDAVHRIGRSTKVMGQLVSDLLEYTGTQLARSLPVRRASCDIGVLCKEVIDRVQTIYPRQEFLLTLAGDLAVMADPTRIQQVLSNLLSNAVHYGTIQKPVTVTAAGVEDTVVLTVSNSGKPIPPAALQTIFDPLVQAPATRAEAHQPPYTGLGLGLFIVREIVSRHQGSVTVESTEASGTVFTVRLPREAAQPKALAS
jgi:signal transduction histidine kinase